MSNRIKELRLEKGLSQRKLSEETGISQQSLSFYEKGDRKPKIETWQKLADYFDVPVGYLQGVSDDLVGWKDWEENTGYSKNEIKKEIDRMVKYNRTKKDDDIQEQINQAIKNLSRHGNDELSAINELKQDIKIYSRKLLEEFFIDKQKTNEHSENMGGMRIIKKVYWYDDMRPEVYQAAIDIISNAQRELSELERKILSGESFDDTQDKD